MKLTERTLSPKNFSRTNKTAEIEFVKWLTAVINFAFIFIQTNERMRLKGKIALITGGANGIGLATTERFAREGAKVIVWDLSDKGKDVTDRLNQGGHEAIFQKVSVTDEEEVQKAVTKAHKHFGRIDTLINNAGITKDSN